MSLLEELKKEAHQAKAAEERRRDTTLRRQAAAEAELGPRMRALYRYFRELKEHLSVLAPGLAASYEAPGVGRLSDLRQCEYRLYTDDDPQEVRKFTFQYSYAREGRHEVRVRNRPAAQQLKDRLWGHGLRFATRDASDGSTVFVLELQVPVSFQFAADVEKGALKLRVRNLEQLGSATYTIEPASVDEPFMEEIARLILHKPSRFDELVGDRVAETTLTRLREQIARDKASRERELRGLAAGGAAKRARAGRPAPAKRSLGERFTRTLLGRKH